MTHYQLIIIGAGSAGLPAGMYASRYNIKNLIIGSFPGGALATSHKVENYPGVISASGKEIMDAFRKHAETFGSEILQDTVETVEKNGDVFIVKTSGKEEFTCDYVLLATGNKYRYLDVPGEKAFFGKGISYCATCDGTFFKGLDVAIVGGGNTALTEALYLAEICKSVKIVHRKETFRAEDVWVEQAKKRDNIEFVLNEEVEEVTGSLFVEELKLKSGKSLKVDGVFVAIGTIPFTSVIDHLDPDKDFEGCVIVDERQASSVKGLYAAGDVTTNSNKFRQTIMSAAEGCLAANSIHEDILHDK